MIDLNVAKIQKLLSMAAHNGTPDTEALNALRAVNNQMNHAGKSLADLTINDSDVYKKFLMTPISKYLMRINELEEDLELERQRVADLVAELKQARNETNRLHHDVVRKRVQAAPVQGHYTFSQFRTATIEQLGRENAWQSEYSEATGTDLSLIQQWRKSNRVPQEAFDKIATLSKVGPRTTVKWTEQECEELSRLYKLTDRKRTDSEIAEMLSAKFGRRITANSIKGQVTRLALR